MINSDFQATALFCYFRFSLFNLTYTLFSHRYLSKAMFLQITADSQDVSIYHTTQ